MTDLEPPEDSLPFDVLAAYLDSLQSGASPNREQVLEQWPELASAIDCLEALDALAGPSPMQGLPTASDSPTVGFVSSGPRSEAADDLAWREFGDYEILDEIGRGGMGVVYRARQKSLNRVVAVKMISSYLASPRDVRRFQTEAQAAAGLHHPNIVGVHEVGQFRGQHYFAMEYVEGESLAARLTRGESSIDDNVRLLAAVARAVDQLHQHGVIHRDLKPSNILLDQAGRPAVTDFGLAKMFTSDSRDTLWPPGAVVGTALYMPPEQAAGQSDNVGPRSDVYSLGVILYEILTGRTPFQGDSPVEILMQVRDSEPPLPKALNPLAPRELEFVCMKCLAKEPGKRYASSAALAEDLERFLMGEGVEARPPNPWGRFKRWARRVPALATRLSGIGVFYLVETLNFARGGVEAEFHLQVTAVLLLWVLASAGFQRLLKRPAWAAATPFAWSATDAALLLSLLLISNGLGSPMTIGFFLVVGAAGLWVQRRLVWFATAATIAAYGFLAIREGNLAEEYIRHIYFVVALLVLGAIVAYQVSRFRALSKFCETSLPR